MKQKNLQENNRTRVLKGTVDDLELVYKIYTEDFPANERKTKEHLAALMSAGKYTLLMAKQLDADNITGYAFIHNIDDAETIWLDYIAVSKSSRGKGYGKEFFKNIMEYWQDKASGMFMEVEIADAEDSTERQKQIDRIAFYEKLGAVKLGIKYMLPTNEGGFSMHLYFKPSHSGLKLSKHEVEESIKSAYRYIHSDICGKESILETVLKALSGLDGGENMLVESK